MDMGNEYGNQEDDKERSRAVIAKSVTGKTTQYRPCSGRCLEEYRGSHQREHDGRYPRPVHQREETVQALVQTHSLPSYSPAPGEGGRRPEHSRRGIGREPR